LSPALASKAGPIFLPRPRPATPLAETVIYRPSSLIAVLFLVPPAASALALASAIEALGGAQFWTALILLLWLPILLLCWLALRAVRLTRDQIAIGRPLRPWRVIPIDAISRLEARGPRLTLVTRAGRITFMPALLARGGELRRRLLLSLPLSALASDARAEAARLLDGALREDEGEEALNVQTPLWLRGVMVALTLALAAAAVITGAMFGKSALGPGLGAVALLALFVTLWLAQDIMLDEHGASLALGGWVTAAASWDQLESIRRAPGELALILLGKRVLVLPGPGLLSQRDARRARQIISRSIRERGLMAAPRSRS
jgi:hypothetical protein